MIAVQRNAYPVDAPVRGIGTDTGRVVVRRASDEAGAEHIEDFSDTAWLRPYTAIAKTIIGVRGRSGKLAFGNRGFNKGGGRMQNPMIAIAFYRSRCFRIHEKPPSFPVRFTTCFPLLSKERAIYV